MAMRRPRIKPVANIQLNSKRKVKSINDVKIVKSSESDVNGVKQVQKQAEIQADQQIELPLAEAPSKSIGNEIEVRVDTSTDTTANENNLMSDAFRNENSVKELEVELGTKVDNNVNANVNNHSKEVEVVMDEGNRNNMEENHLKVLEAIDPSHVLSSDDFKCPPKVEFQRSISHTSNSGVDDVFYSDIEENAIQMDMEKPSSNGYPMSPSKSLTRQRIRPTPHFSQRRNSFVACSPSPHAYSSEDHSNSNVNNNFVQSIQTRRERHNSASHLISSSHHHYHTTHKYLPVGITSNCIGRIRTESGCSAFSDTNMSSHKSRKMEDNKQNTRKDFEARFVNGVPEKSAIKMSDLIYYNPATNPMEQKTNPNVKLEQADNSSNDVKPFVEKLENDIDTSTENEAAPVPQLKLNAKGELILDDKSLVIETTAEQEARKVLANSSLIYLDENTGMNGFYSRQKRTREWLPSETIKFYRCLQNVGTDFSLMVSLFPNRTRRDLKLKFKKEERKNGHLINKALLYPKQFDLEALKQQIDEEEKLREEQAKSAKSCNGKSKESRKRKVCTSSVANRVLLCEDIYQNENAQKPKRVRKTNSKDKSDQNTTSLVEADVKTNDDESGKNEIEQKSQQGKNIYNKLDTVNNVKEDGVNSNNNNNDIDKNNIQHKNDVAIVNKTKRRRRRTPSKVVKKEEINIIKETIIKIENKQDSTNTSEAADYHERIQLQTEIDELLDTDAVDANYYSTPYNKLTADLKPMESHVEQNENINTFSHDDNYYETEMDMDKYEHRTIVNLDDGSVNIYKNIKDDNFNTPRTTLSSQSELNNETCSSVISERELNEEDIQSILSELADGSLVLVSTLDPDDPDKVLNEIYMVDKSTGELFDEPLNIPENIVQSILSVVS